MMRVGGGGRGRNRGLMRGGGRAGGGKAGVVLGRCQGLLLRLGSEGCFLLYFLMRWRIFVLMRRIERKLAYSMHGFYNLTWLHLRDRLQ